MTRQEERQEEMIENLNGTLDILESLIILNLVRETEKAVENF